MILDYGLCGLGAETNSLEDLLAFVPFDDLGGNCPNHCIIVWGMVWLWPFLVAWARGFQVGLLPWV